MAFSKFYVNGQTGLASNWTLWFGDFFSNFVGTGFEITEDTGLDISISAGRAYIKDEDGNMFQVISGAIESLTMADDSTNYVYLHCDNGSSWLTTDTIGTVDTDAILLGVVTTDTGAITLITNTARNTPLLKSIQPTLTQSSVGTISSNATNHSQVYPIGSGSCGSCSARANTFNSGNMEITNLNYFKNRYVLLEKMIITLTTNGNAPNWTKLYYNIGGSNVLLEEFTGSDVNGTHEYTLNVTTTDPTVQPYFYVEMNSTQYRSSCTNSSNPVDATTTWYWTCRYTGLTISNLVLDYSYQ